MPVKTSTCPSSVSTPVRSPCDTCTTSVTPALFPLTAGTAFTGGHEIHKIQAKAARSPIQPRMRIPRLFPFSTFIRRMQNPQTAAIVRIHPGMVCFPSSSTAAMSSTAIASSTRHRIPLDLSFTVPCFISIPVFPAARLTRTFLSQRGL